MSEVGAGFPIRATRDAGVLPRARDDRTRPPPFGPSHSTPWTWPRAGPPGVGGAQTTDPETTDQRWAAHLEQPPAEQLLDQTCAPEHVLVEAGVDHAGVRGIGSDGAALGGQQALQVVGEQDQGQLATSVGAVRGVAASARANGEVV